MAQAAEQRTPREWSLEDYLDDLVARSGCNRRDALSEMCERFVHGRLIFIRQKLVDGRPYNPWDRKPYDKEQVDPYDFDAFYRLDFDSSGRVRVLVLRTESFEYRYTVAELPRLSASQTAPVQQLEDKVGSDQKAEGRQVRRLKQAFKEKFPPAGQPPNDLTLKEILVKVEPIFKAQGWKLPGVDSVARATGRRRT
jgi:hypothetical protein